MSIVGNVLVAGVSYNTIEGALINDVPHDGPHEPDVALDEELDVALDEELDVALDEEMGVAVNEEEAEEEPEDGVVGTETVALAGVTGVDGSGDHGWK
jgi:hypothetical protein